MACVPLKAVYIPQPRTMASRGMRSVRSSSERRTCRTCPSATSSRSRAGPMSAGIMGSIPAAGEVLWTYVLVPGHRGPAREHRPAGPDRRPDQAVAEGGKLVGVVLVVEGPHRAVELVEHPRRLLPRRRPLDVQGLGPRQVEDLPAALLEAVAEVEVLAVHEIGGVEKADLGDRGPAHQQA